MSFFSVFYELYWFYEPLLDTNGNIQVDVLERILLEIARLEFFIINSIRQTKSEPKVYILNMIYFHLIENYKKLYFLSSRFSVKLKTIF